MLIRDGKAGIGCDWMKRVLGHMCVKHTACGKVGGTYFVGRSEPSWDKAQPPQNSKMIYPPSAERDPENDSFVYGMEFRSETPPLPAARNMEES